MTDNMKLWNAVEKTAPAYTKDFSRAGGFKGTAVNPTYLIRKATEIWGAIGKGWGYDIVEDKYVDGAPVIINNEVVCRESIHVIRLALWFKDGEEIVKCPHQFGQTTFVGKNKYGVFTDEEAPKKSVTDALKKCLSALGFAADIHMGMYDDDKYVNDLRAQYKNGSAEEKVENVPASPTAPSLPTPEQLYKEIEEALTAIELGKIVTRHKRGLNLMKIESPAVFEKVQKKLTDRKIELVNAVTRNGFASAVSAPLDDEIPF